MNYNPVTSTELSYDRCCGQGKVTTLSMCMGTRGPMGNSQSWKTNKYKWQQMRQDQPSVLSILYKRGVQRRAGQGEGTLPCFPALSKSSLRSWSSKELAHLECLWSLWPSDPRNRRENKQISLPTEGKKTYKTTDSISCAETTQKMKLFEAQEE